MAAVIYLDTHAVAWLYAGLTDRFAAAALSILDAEPLYVSPMVELELQCLLEIGRIAQGGRTVVSELEAKIGLRVCDQPVPDVVAMALDQTWTRDPFDRLIVAQAAVTDSWLLTKDQTIRDHYARALWTGSESMAGTS